MRILEKANHSSQRAGTRIVPGHAVMASLLLGIASSAPVGYAVQVGECLISGAYTPPLNGHYVAGRANFLGWNRADPVFDKAVNFLNGDCSPGSLSATVADVENTYNLSTAYNTSTVNLATENLALYIVGDQSDNEAMKIQDGIASNTARYYITAHTVDLDNSRYSGLWGAIDANFITQSDADSSFVPLFGSSDPAVIDAADTMITANAAFGSFKFAGDDIYMGIGVSGGTSSADMEFANTGSAILDATHSGVNTELKVTHNGPGNFTYQGDLGKVGIYKEAASGVTVVPGSVFRISMVANAEEANNVTVGQVGLQDANNIAYGFSSSIENGESKTQITGVDVSAGLSIGDGEIASIASRGIFKDIDASAATTYFMSKEAAAISPIIMAGDGSYRVHDDTLQGGTALEFRMSGTAQGIYRAAGSSALTIADEVDTSGVGDAPTLTLDGSGTNNVVFNKDLGGMSIATADGYTGTATIKHSGAARLEVNSRDLVAAETNGQLKIDLTEMHDGASFSITQAAGRTLEVGGIAADTPSFKVEFARAYLFFYNENTGSTTIEASSTGISRQNRYQPTQGERMLMYRIEQGSSPSVSISLDEITMMTPHDMWYVTARGGDDFTLESAGYNSATSVTPSINTQATLEPGQILRQKLQGVNGFPYFFDDSSLVARGATINIEAGTNSASQIIVRNALEGRLNFLNTSASRAQHAIKVDRQLETLSVSGPATLDIAESAEIGGIELGEYADLFIDASRASTSVGISRYSGITSDQYAETKVNVESPFTATISPSESQYPRLYSTGLLAYLRAADNQGGIESTFMQSFNSIEVTDGMRVVSQSHVRDIIGDFLDANNAGATSNVLIMPNETSIVSLLLSGMTADTTVLSDNPLSMAIFGNVEGTYSLVTGNDSANANITVSDTTLNGDFTIDATAVQGDSTVRLTGPLYFESDVGDTDTTKFTIVGTTSPLKRTTIQQGNDVSATNFEIVGEYTEAWLQFGSKGTDYFANSGATYHICMGRVGTIGLRPTSSRCFNGAQTIGASFDNIFLDPTSRADLVISEASVDDVESVVSKVIGGNQLGIYDEHVIDEYVISDLQDDIDDNSAAIEVNASDIAANSNAIGENASDIAANSAAIGENASAIAANSAAIGENAGAIATNASYIAAIGAIDTVHVFNNGLVTSTYLQAGEKITELFFIPQGLEQLAGHLLADKSHVMFSNLQSCRMSFVAHEVSLEVHDKNSDSLIPTHRTWSYSYAQWLTTSLHMFDVWAGFNLSHTDLTSSRGAPSVSSNETALSHHEQDLYEFDVSTTVTTNYALGTGGGLMSMASANKHKVARITPTLSIGAGRDYIQRKIHNGDQPLSIANHFHANSTMGLAFNAPMNDTIAMFGHAAYSMEFRPAYEENITNHIRLQWQPRTVSVLRGNAGMEYMRSMGSMSQHMWLAGVVERNTGDGFNEVSVQYNTGPDYKQHYSQDTRFGAQLGVSFDRKLMGQNLAFETKVEFLSDQGDTFGTQRYAVALRWK